jgi:hypothetical protein
MSEEIEYEEIYQSDFSSDEISDDEELNTFCKRIDEIPNSLLPKPNIKVKVVEHKKPRKNTLIQQIREKTDVFTDKDLKYLSIGALVEILSQLPNKHVVAEPVPEPEPKPVHVQKIISPIPKRIAPKPIFEIKPKPQPVVEPVVVQQPQISSNDNYSKLLDLFTTTNKFLMEQYINNNNKN